MKKGIEESDRELKKLQRIEFIFKKKEKDEVKETIVTRKEGVEEIVGTAASAAVEEQVRLEVVWAQQKEAERRSQDGGEKAQ